MHWRDIIEIKGDFKTSNAPDMTPFRDRIEKFLDYLENTEDGQKMFQSLKDKWGDKKLEMQMSDYVPNSKIYANGSIMLSPHDEKYVAFLDVKTGKPHAMVFESIIYHELAHAMDPHLAVAKGDIPIDIEDANHRPLNGGPTENFAVQKTDEFAREHMPSWGIRGFYPNKMDLRHGFNLDVSTGMDHLNSNPSALEMLKNLIESWKQAKSFTDVESNPGETVPANPSKNLSVKP